MQFAFTKRGIIDVSTFVDLHVQRNGWIVF